MSRQVSRGSTGEYQADEQAGVARCPPNPNEGLVKLIIGAIIQDTVPREAVHNPKLVPLTNNNNKLKEVSVLLWFSNVLIS